MGKLLTMRRIGPWTYGNHEGLNPGWRLDGTNLVLDFDPGNTMSTPVGCYLLWEDGQPGPEIDHYLHGAMQYVEQMATVRGLATITAR